MLYGGTFVLTIPVSVKLLTRGLHGSMRHHLLLHGQSTDKRVRAMRGVRVVLRLPSASSVAAP